MRTWLRDNRVALATIPLCLGLLAVLLVALPNADPREAVVETVPVGEAGELDGVQYQVTDAGEFGRAQQLRLPAGASLTAALVTVTPVGRSVGSCSFVLTGPVDDTRRTWPAESDVSRYGYGRGEGFEQSCVTRPAEAYRAELVFLTPARALRTAVLEVRSLRKGSARADVLRLRLPTSRTAR